MSPALPFILVLAGVVAAAALTPRPHMAHAEPLASITLTFADMPNGAVAVREAGSGRLVSLVAADHDGFLRSTMRVLVGLRRHEHIGAAAPFELASLPGNRLVLTDDATGQALELEAFGPSNAAEFIPFLPPERPL
jgi:putative photosynthetic complex assembly protein